MPRALLERRYWERVRERNRRRRSGVATQWRPASGRVGFIDYWPWIPATLPEKMVFAELVRRQINFYFSWYIGDLPASIEERERVRPDFYLPDYNLIIEVQGVYWHTRPGAFQQDAERFFLLLASGFNVYFVTDVEVISNVTEALNKIPELASASIHGNMHVVGDRPFDPRAAIRSRTRKWPKVFEARYRKTHRDATPVRGKWQTAGPVPATPDPPDPIFLGRNLDDEFLSAAQEAYAGWTEYLDELDAFFDDPSSFSRFGEQAQFWEIYEFWQRFRNWAFQ